MLRKSFIKLLFSLFIIGGGPTLALAETTSTTTVEFSFAIHFLNPAGDDIEVGPGMYQVEPAESWLKLLPEGQGRAEAVLLEATSGTHDETVTEPVVRLESATDNPDVFHLGLLLADGTGLEAIGTTSGIRARGLNLAFVRKSNQSSRTFTQRPRVKLKSSPTVPSQPGNLSFQVGKQPPRLTPIQADEVDCGPYINQLLGRSKGVRTPTIALFRNRLHVVYPHDNWLTHQEFDGEKWHQKIYDKKISIPRASTKKDRVALASYQDRLHMVYRSGSNLIHFIFDGQKWSSLGGITGQKSKAAPALAVHYGELHMLHLGKSSNDLWHSVYRGKGWTINQKIGLKSGHTPALATLGGLRMVYTQEQPSFGKRTPYLYWASYKKGKWNPMGKIPGQLSKTAPAFVSFLRGGRGEWHLFHLGKSSNNLWYGLLGRHPTKLTALKWFKEEKLFGLSSDSPVSVVFHEGCMHMVSRHKVSYGKKEVRHTTFSPRVP